MQARADPDLGLGRKNGCVVHAFIYWTAALAVDALRGARADTGQA